ncbi:hypothetical protein KCP73_23130 [Salmonella enterica subsp. enterica]|nr:hypothetical protein KCP73_23130 [Salmonella enterica subsp. enterica]
MIAQTAHHTVERYVTSRCPQLNQTHPTVTAGYERAAFSPSCLFSSLLR